MFQAFYIFRVRREDVARFIEIVKAAGVIYRKHGAVNSAVMRITSAAEQYGCMGLANVIPPNSVEELFIGVDSFRDAEQFNLLMPKIDADPEIGHLFHAIQQIVDLKTVIRWEAEDAG